MLNSRIVDKRISGKSWKCIVIDYRDIDGKKKQKCKKTSVKSSDYERGKKKIVAEEQNKFVKEFQKQLEKEQGKSFEYNNLTVKEMMELYAESKKKSVVPQVYQDYFRYMKKMEAYLASRHLSNIKLKNFTADLLDEFYRFVANTKNRYGESISNNTIKHYMCFFNPVFRMAYEKDYIEKDITKGIKPPPITKQNISYLKEEYCSKFIKAAESSRVGFELKLLLLLGVRRSELLGITWNDIDFQENQISINKAVHKGKGGKLYITNKLKTNSSNRVLPLDEDVKELLLNQKELLASCKKRLGKEFCKDKHFKDFICLDYKGDLINPERLTRAVKSVCKKHKLPDIHLHSLRHSYASVMVSNGVDMKTTQTLLGHSNFSTTADIYSHLDMKNKWLAVEKVKGVFTKK